MKSLNCSLIYHNKMVYTSENINNYNIIIIYFFNVQITNVQVNENCLLLNNCHSHGALDT